MKMPLFPARLIAFLCPLLLGLAGCGGGGEDSSVKEAGAGLVPVVEGSEVFKVLEVDPTSDTAWLQRPGEEDTPIGVLLAKNHAAVLRAGEQIRGNLREHNGVKHLDRIWPAPGLEQRRFYIANDQLQRTAATMGSRAIVTEGDLVPDFALVDHAGNPFCFSDLRGREVVMNFIFTRCGDINMCPAANARMVELAEAVAKNKGVEPPQFLVISFDPENDTPAMLHLFASGLGVSYPDFRFACGAPRVIEDLLRVFGVSREETDGTYVHTMVTLLIDQAGRVRYRRDGSYWTIEEFVTRFSRRAGEESAG